MGGSAPLCGSVKPEVANRAPTSRTAYRQFASKVLAAGTLTFAVKLSFIRSLVVSKLFYNACVWSGFDPKDLAPLDT
eukprot:11196490-Lingulodinium_polyedra.AAC.1